ncbi:MAG: efflux RND transporter periplasmic adaptor subunit [Candidatus Sumerlaeia bacterium]|nr:efflux RND transporter periplasmic adaptor subunit [Candidatus Sumerlaeia bacterium]
MNKLVLLIIALLIIAAPVGLFYFVKANEPAPTERSSPPTPVIITKVERIPFEDRVEALGTATANESVQITPKVSEIITAIHFRDGEVVEKGQLLVELRADEELAKLEEERASIEEERAAIEQSRANLLEQEAAKLDAESRLVEVENQLARVRALFQQGSVPESDLDRQVSALQTARSAVESAKARMSSADARILSSKARLRSAEARISSSEARLEDRKIHAPFAGVTGFREVSLGSLVTPNSRITTLDDVSIIKLDFQVPERFLSTLRPGLEIEAISSSLRDKVFKGTVSSVGSRVDPITRSVTVRADIPNPDYELRPGMLLLVDLIRDLREALVVPEEAIVPLQGGHYVYIVDEENKAQRIRVEIGTRIPGSIEIRSGLEEGDLVVTEGTVRIRPGSPVEIIEIRGEE